MSRLFEMCTVSAFALLACACNDSTGPRLAVDEVAGVYQLCSLTFTPTNTTLPSVDVRAAAIEAYPDGGLPRPNLKVDADRTFELEYVATGKVRPNRPSGSFSLGETSIRLNFAGGSRGEVGAVLLLPSRLSLELATSPRALVASGTGASHNVARADYARLARVQETGLAAQIPGTTAARFAPSCQ